MSGHSSACGMWLVLAALALPSTGKADATLVFSGDDGHRWEAWSLSVEHSRLTQLTRNADAVEPSVTHDGRLAYADSDGVIWYQPTPSEAARPIDGLPAPCGQPAWAPDLKRIAAACFTFGNRKDDGALWIADLEAGTVNEIYDGPGLQKSPQWSPDGRQLTFVSGFRLTPVRVLEQIWALELATGKARQLHEDAAAQISPAWSPDGETIAFASDRSGNLDLWLLRLADGRVRQLTTHAGLDDHPSWSADGELIAFHSTRGGALEIWVVPASGGRARRLVAARANGGTGPVSASNPGWAVAPR